MYLYIDWFLKQDSNQWSNIPVMKIGYTIFICSSKYYGMPCDPKGTLFIAAVTIIFKLDNVKKKLESKEK